MIRLAVEADTPSIIDMVELLAAAVSGPQTPCRIKTGRTITGLIHSPDGAVWLSDGGFIAGCITQTIISPDPVAIELGWWASDRSGLALLRTFERWAHERGATLIKLTCNGGPAQAILERSGYRVAEIQMVR